jgi:hypothetical protein
MRPLALFALLASAGCDTTAAPGDLAGGGGDGGEPADLAAPQPDLSQVPTVSGTFTFVLDAGAFPPTDAYPSALVYLPSGFDPTPPIDVLVYLHGNNNCVENVVRDAGEACTPGGPVRNAYSLAAQLEATGKRALLLVPELAYDQANSSGGKLELPGGFRALLTEVLADLTPVIGTLALSDVRSVIVASHSGGYRAAAGVANVGGVPINELYMLDSIYGTVTPYEMWVKSNLSLFGASPLTHRFADVYLQGGSTAADSTLMAGDVAQLVSPDAGILIDDRSTATWPDSMYLHGLLFKASMLQHDDIPRYYFGKLVGTSVLQAK